MLGHDDGVAAVRGRIERTVDGRFAHQPDAVDAADGQLAGAAVVVERFILRAGEQVLIGTDRQLLSLDFLHDRRLGEARSGSFLVRFRDGLEQDVRIV